MSNPFSEVSSPSHQEPMESTLPSIVLRANDVASSGAHCSDSSSNLPSAVIPSSDKVESSEHCPSLDASSSLFEDFLKTVKGGQNPSATPEAENSPGGALSDLILKKAHKNAEFDSPERCDLPDLESLFDNVVPAKVIRENEDQCKQLDLGSILDSIPTLKGPSENSGDVCPPFSTPIQRESLGGGGGGGNKPDSSGDRNRHNTPQLLRPAENINDSGLSSPAIEIAPLSKILDR